MAVDLIPNFDATKINQQNACVASYVGLSCHLLSKVAKKCSPQVNIFSCLLLSRLEFFCCFYVSLAGVLSHGRWSEIFFLQNIRQRGTLGNKAVREEMRSSRRYSPKSTQMKRVTETSQWLSTHPTCQNNLLCQHTRPVEGTKERNITAKSTLLPK